MSRPSVLFVHPGSELYGSDRMAVVTVRALIRDGMSVVVVVPESGPLIKLFEETGARVLVRPAVVIRKKLLKPTSWPALAKALVSSMLSSRRFLQRLKPDLVYVNTITQPTWMLASRLERRPFICHVREAENSAPRAVRAALTAAPSTADALVYNSAATQAFVERSSLRRIHHGRVVYNGKNWTPFFQSEPRTMPQSPHLVVVGRLNPRKGQHIVIEAMEIVRRRSGLTTTATFVGDVFPGYEWYAEELRAQATRAGLGEMCDFVGFTPDIPTYLAAADVAIVPSLIEPFGTVAAEAMAAMRPTIAARTEGLAEIVEHDATGLLFEPGNGADLATCITRLAQDPALSLRLAVEGQTSIFERFSETNYETAICTVAREVASKIGRRS